MITFCSDESGSKKCLGQKSENIQQFSGHVDTRIEAFLEWFVREKLEQLDDEEFNQAVTTLVKLKSQVDVTLAEEVNRNWSEIVSREYMFDRRETEIKFLESCDKNQMVKECCCPYLSS